MLFLAVSVLTHLIPHLPEYRNDKKKHDMILFVTPVKDRVVERVTRNIAHAQISTAANLNIRAVLGAKYLVVVQQAIPIIQKTLTI